MPQIKVIITYDKPEDHYWLNPDNVNIALQAYCPNTVFDVEWADDGIPVEWREALYIETRFISDHW